MKKGILLAVFLGITVSTSMAKKDCVIRKSQGSITFAVDENLPAPTHYVGERSCGNVAKSILSDVGFGQNTIVTSSFDNVDLVRMGKDTFFSMVCRAYADHRPLVIAPDDVWLLICQGLAQHINKNADSLRSMFVDHQDKKTLVVWVPSDKPLFYEEDAKIVSSPANWTGVFDDFVRQLKTSTKGNFAQNVCADFTTTTVESRIASQITLMDAMEPYFGYSAIYGGCGIPYITLTGIPKDWETILHRAESLKQYGLEWWIKDLLPVLKEFRKTAQGHPDQQFWRCMVTQIAPDKIRSAGGCSPSQVRPTVYDGWFLHLFPYDKHGRTPDKVAPNREMLKEVMSVDFMYMDISVTPAREIPMQFYAGLVGVEENRETYELKSHIGWFVCIKEQKQEKKK